MMTETPEILPCAFCGSMPHSHADNIQHNLDDLPWKGQWIIECNACPVDSSTWAPTKEKAIEQWNTRVPPSTVGVEAVALAVFGDDQEMPECIRPLGWLHTMIEACRRIAPTLPEDADPDAWYEMINEVRGLHDGLKAALQFPTLASEKEGGKAGLATIQAAAPPAASLIAKGEGK